MYFKVIIIDRIFERNYWFILSALSFLTLISFGSFCYDNDPFDNNDLPDFACQSPNISSRHGDQVTFINILNQPNAVPFAFSKSHLTRSPPE